MPSNKNTVTLKYIFIFFLLLMSIYLVSISFATNKKQENVHDTEKIQSYFKNRFPSVPLEDFSNGVYALDKIARENWDALEEFPPYEIHIDTGADLWEQDIKLYSSCFPNGPGIKHLYPQWEDQLKTVITLPLAINLCRKQYELVTYDYMSEELNSLLAYMAYQSRGNKIDIKVPNQDALNAYQLGKKFYFTRRGQLNFACHHCHFDNAGKLLRTETLGPALGQTTGWPTYRNAWGALGSLHRRYSGCNKQVRAAPFELQSETYRNLEYFHTHMNNGLPINGPSVRR